MFPRPNAGSDRAARAAIVERPTRPIGARNETIATAGERSLAELVRNPEFRRMRLYEPGAGGPFRRWFRNLPHYRQSDYCATGAGCRLKPGIPCEDLERLSFPDESFVLVITSDIFEHVRRPERGFAEIDRALKPGGCHIFTVPLIEPIPPASRTRVVTSGDADAHLVPARYHGDGKGGRSLVCTDFGADILDLLANAGFETLFCRPCAASPAANRIVTLISKRR